jgi:hypothetical protein
MDKRMNPKVKVGDRISLLYMEDELDVDVREKGTVKSVNRDPFENDECYIISVEWDGGSTLSLLSCRDVYRLIESKINEETDSNRSENQIDFIINNRDVVLNFNREKIFNYLNILRKSGVINMFGAAPFLYSGRDWIDRYYGENEEYNEAFQEVLEMADDIKNEMILGMLKTFKDNTPALGDMNHLIKKLSNRVTTYWMMFF